MAPYFDTLRDTFNVGKLYGEAVVENSDMFLPIPAAGFVARATLRNPAVRAELAGVKDMILNASVRATNYLDNTVTPSIYRGINYLMQPSTATTLTGGAEVANDILNVSSPIPSTKTGTIGSIIINTYDYINKNENENDK